MYIQYRIRFFKDLEFKDQSLILKETELMPQTQFL